MNKTRSVEMCWALDCVQSTLRGHTTRFMQNFARLVTLLWSLSKRRNYQGSLRRRPRLSA
jgi:hypothetical protein